MKTKKPVPEWLAEFRASEAEQSAKLRADIRASVSETINKYAAEAEAERRKHAAEAEEERRKHAAEAEEERRKHAAAAEARHKEVEEEFREMREFLRILSVEVRELRESVRLLEYTFGGFAEGEGRILEIECMAALRAARRIGKIAIDEFHHGMTVTRDNIPVAEYDIVGFNCDSIVVAEVKRRLRKSDILRFVEKQLPEFARYFPHEARGKKVRGAMIYKYAQKNGKTGNDPVQLALDSGLILLQANAKNELNHITKSP